MSTGKHKVKLTLTVDKRILEKAKRVAEKKPVSISGLVENFLDFFVDPKLYCFKCGDSFQSNDSVLCPKCGWMECPNCGVCRCDLDEEVAVAIFHMRKVYEDLLVGRVKQG